MLSIEDNKKKWDFFQKHHWVSPEFMLSPILESWERCSKQSSPYNWSKPHIASGYTLKSLIKRNERVITCATTVIEDTYDLLRDEAVILFVTDDSGCVLFTVGHDDLLREVNELGLKKGCFFSEGKLGTNAISLTLNTHMPAEVFAAEHFNRHLHPYATTAAPIFDTFGRLRGTISLLKRAKEYSKENHVIISSCAKEIALQIHVQNEQENMNRLLNAHNATLECMDDGLLAWNDENRITMTNLQAERLLKFKTLDVIEKDIFSIVRFAPSILRSIEENSTIRRKQTTVEIGGEFIESIITLRPLVDGSKLLFIHPIDKIRELAQQQIGGSAKYTFANLNAQSKGMKHVITVAKRAIKSKAPILITGEEGVGKSDLAMAIHNESDFKDGPFISINCRSLTSEAMIREMLGYDDEDSHGLPSKFELAHNGSLYLEKIEYLSPELQTVILKLLKTGLVSRSDSQRLIPVAFQLITSTTSDISEYVAQRSFGRQLYYEISSNELNIPPLRKRKEDIEQLVMMIITNYEKRHNVAVSIERTVMEALVQFSWQGNNSELKSRMERILLNRSSNMISLADIPEEIKHNSNDAMGKSGKQILTLEEVEKKAIIQAWNMFDGKMQDMAKALNIGRTTLWRKIQKYGLDDQTLS
ncbi:dihydroxyacetone kinase operon transcriptional regulator DhaR [Vibrio barjaei]|uniref:Dihydroxyacetone kinase operon transcriptional regulator DhaR n=1 Tax=Vibrio barjaei TaxID=1676683 RepID=A0ABW7ICE2_9VIBR|nr:dihydroxyacetone kinase operon transcriptional regulator DhaR [Vibrio barjaei]MCY9871568.1 dihydroxyacetone kinase operon transcriptional regulator DhaR [Vibrio barjaei]OIN26768.1 PTS-dependent dihydroxyacetone kinase operon transcriptional regulator DhaR [Vibrio barjaei]